MTNTELSRPLKSNSLPAEPITIEATDEEKTKLAARFDLVSIQSFLANVDLKMDGKKIYASGKLVSDFTQTCAISSEEFPNSVEEIFAFHFVPVRSDSKSLEEEIELTGDELDEIEYDLDVFDLGEAIAQSFGLAIDPYAEGPSAEVSREVLGLISDEEPAGIFGQALKGLVKD